MDQQDSDLFNIVRQMFSEGQAAEGNTSSQTPSIEMVSEVLSLRLPAVQPLYQSLQETSIPPRRAYVLVVEQPLPRMRFRFRSERIKSEIVGINNSSQNNSYPTIQIPGYRGQALVVVSCVTKESPYRPHPHELDGDNCRHGILRKEVSIAENMSISFEKVYLVRSKIVDIQKNLEVRKKNCIDPFQTGNFPPVTGGDMHGIRLCFEVFLPPQEPYHHERWHPLDPVVSDPIANRRASKILRIHKLSHTSASVAGGQEVMMFCDDIKNINNIEVTFFDNQGWEANASFNPSTDIHRKVGIFFRTPAYHNLRIWEPLTIFVQLREPRDGFHGEPHEFTLQPQEVAQIEHKKRKLDRNSSHCQALMNLVPGHTPFAFRQRPDSTLYESSVGKNNQFESLPDLMEQPSISGQNKHVDPLLNLKNSMQPVVEHWMLSELHSSSCTNATYSGPPPEIFDFHEHQAQSDQIGQNLLLNKNLIEGMTLNVPGINCLPGVNPAECPLTSLVHEACDPGEDEAVTVSLSMPALTAILNSVEETIQARIQDSAEGEKM